ncbi:lysophospholipid acyltransferase family protein [Ilumatobacter nonamiensis]|uniref:lysophospholipid acyltransferase family protein n=1 Tax=Ilumatobacter nonamiensis TaxID=467093 RepID=UPI0003471827|nr:lysophospholipid acyltransferase family protein [Ilumatobacter nonamiensis]
MDTTSGAGHLQRHTRRVAKPAVTRLWNIDVSGYEKLPTVGPAILCPNHISFLDSAFLTFTAPRNVSFIGKSEYMDSWKTKFLFPAMGMIPIDRSGGDKCASALDAAREVLERGELFTVFPEGSRSRDGFLHKGRTGAARLAMSVGCPIYPVGILGTDAIQPPGATIPKLGRSCSITVGEPIDPARYAGADTEPLGWRAMTDDVMQAVGKLTGQPYADHYAGEAPAATELVASVTPIGRVTAPVDIERELVAAV